MATAEFVHLHGHSEYSLLDGGCHVAKMATKAADFGMSALALTDHGNLFGAVEHFKSCKDVGITPIIGCEVYVAVGSRQLRQAARGLNHASNHLVLLAQNQIGYRNLTKLVSKAYTEGYYYFPRIDKELLRQHSEGLVCLSACLSGEIAHLLDREGLQEAEEAAREYKDIFGDRYYLEIQRHGIDREKKVNDGILKLHAKLGIPLVATNDFHFLGADDHTAHDALICIQTGKTVADQNRMCYPDGLYMKSPKEMHKLFSDLPEAVENTLKIADQCHIEFEFDTMHLPKFPIPDGHTDEKVYLTFLAEQGLDRRYESPDDGIRKRLQYELDTINGMGYSGYFLIVQDYVQFARSHGIPVGPGRGSGAGSLVAYCLGITGTDPIGRNLLFERFLNPERKEFPDIDVDFADTGRDQVIKYVIDKYGEQNVCQVITFGTMGAKAVIRDVGRVLGMEFGEVDRIAKLIPNELKITLGKAIERVPELQQMNESNDEKGQLIAHALKLEGLARHASVHAAAVIIAPGDLTDFVPLYRAPKDGRITTQFDGNTCNDIGLLKMDFLGLKELSLMDEAMRLIRLDQPEFDLETVPWDDVATFRLFGAGETIGVFQFESSGQREYLKQLKPDNIDDIIAMNALYRPGPMEKIPTFIARKHGREPVNYDHPDMESSLAETYGVMVYQEQVMSVAQKLAGFSLGQAYTMIKAISKKRTEQMAEMKKDFISGCMERSVDQRTAEKIFGDIAVFAGYGFNRSHSAPYSEIAYKNAYLKANYPKQYMAASLTVARDNTDTLTVLLDECRKMEIEVLPPDINGSALNFTPTGDGIRFGLAAIKNVGAGAAQSVVDARMQDGDFPTLVEFCERVDLRSANRRVMESLIAAGALDSLEGNRAQQFEALDMALRWAQKAQEDRERGQISLFGGEQGDGGAAELGRFQLPEVQEWDESDRLRKERELLGFYLSGHPLHRYANDLQAFATPLASLEQLDEGMPIRVGGLVTRVSDFERRGQRFAFVTLEDLTGVGDIAFFSESYEAYSPLLQDGKALLVSGRVSVRNGRSSVQSDAAWPLEEVREQLTKSLNLELPFEEVREEVLAELRQLFQRYLGECELLLHLKNGGEKDTVVRSRSIRVRPCDELLKEIDGIIGPKRTWLTAAPQRISAVPTKNRFARA